MCFYGRFRSIRTIRTPTMTIAANKAATAGTKYKSAADRGCAVGCAIEDAAYSPTIKYAAEVDE